MLSRRRALPYLVALLALAPACAGSQGSEQAGEAKSEATVDTSVAKRAFAIIRDIDYLPFAYKDDGCYARALYMSMELAAAKIPSSAEFIAGNLTPPGEMWRFHVAPMLQVIGQNHQTIIDPSIAPGPLPVADWTLAVNPQGKYNTFYVPGSTYVSNLSLDQSRTYKSVMITSFRELPPFNKADIEDACQMMWNALSWEEPAHDELRPKLIARTDELVSTLKGLGKFADSGDGGAIDCAVPRDQ